MPKRATPAGGSPSEVSVRLRELADELDGGGAHGVMVIIDDSTPERERFRTVHVGNLQDSRERALWALSRVKHFLVSYLT